MTQRWILLWCIWAGMAALLGWMELRHEVERIGPRNALVTNHFTGEVKNCDTYGHGDWSCWPVDIEPRPWVLALIPFWPPRDNLGDRLSLSETWTPDAAFTDTPLFQDLVANGAIGLVMLLASLYVVWVTKHDADDRAGDDGSGH